MSIIFETVSEILAKSFIRTQRIARVLSLGLETKQNILLYGPGGHGKSEMVQAALEAVYNPDDIFTMSFGEGMSEDALWGGLDLKALEVEGVIRYLPENSFLAAKVAVFEELLDAPTVVLLALKDTLQRRKLMKGKQTFAMATDVVIAVTNKEPSEIEELGPAARALMERFPLRLRVAWDSYKSHDYLELFPKVEPRIPGAHMNGHLSILAELLAKAGETAGYPISPRTAIHAVRIVKKAAQMRGASHVERQDLLDLAFLPGMEDLASSIQNELDKAYERAKSEGLMAQAWGIFFDLENQVNGERSPIRLLQLEQEVSTFADDLSSVSVTDEKFSDKESLIQRIHSLRKQAVDAAKSNTRPSGQGRRLFADYEDEDDVALSAQALANLMSSSLIDDDEEEEYEFPQPSRSTGGFGQPRLQSKTGASPFRRAK